MNVASCFNCIHCYEKCIALGVGLCKAEEESVDVVCLDELCEGFMWNYSK